MIYQLDGQSPKIDSAAGWIAPSADLMGKVRVEAAASIWFGAVLRGDNEWITVGSGSNVQDGSICHTDPGCPLHIGKDVTIGHKVILHGCTIEDEVLVGMGATVMNRAVIGRGSIVGAGALITEGKSFPPFSLILGAPAKLAKTLDEEVLQQIRLSAAVYQANARRFQSGLEAIS